MKVQIPIYIIVCLTIASISCKNEVGKASVAKKTSKNETSQFNSNIREYYFHTLDSAGHYIKKMDTLQSITANQENFLKSRMWYKKLEPLLIAYDYENYLSMNAPNLLKVEMEDYTDIKKLKPKSYQVLEELLFGDEDFSNQELHNVLAYLQARIPYIKKNHIIYEQRDRHHLKMIRDAIVNIATKGITGFDSPMLASSLQEAIYNYESIRKVIDIYRNAFENPQLYRNWVSEVDESMLKLEKGEFDSFNRYDFIKNHTNKQLKLLNATSNDWNISLNTSRPLNPTSENLFAKDFFNIKMFSLPGSPPMSKKRVDLGKALFNDKTLSKSGAMSCATCHVEEKAFTDDRKIALGNSGSELLRNTPSLAYTVYQTTFFYDGRGDGLEGQIASVVNNKDEFHLDLKTMSERVQKNPAYTVAFDSLYGGDVNNANVRNAIATYIRSLAPFDSKFDRNMQGVETSLSDDEVQGFNLFMGKGACATCHFPPAFNGLVPPKYKETEFENLGIPKNASFTYPILDDDPGQFYPFEVEEKRGFFKTSTVRNAELTGPYMHNGVYDSLEEVMEFYNAGGGGGMGLDVPYQTLPTDSLNLDTSEIEAIIDFMKTLTDKQFTKP